MEEKSTGIKQPVPAQPPTEQPEAELPSPVLEQKSRVNKFTILGGILGVLIFVGAIFGAYQLGQKQLQPQPSPSPEAVVTPTPDPTADWRVYTNETLGFKFKYPSNSKWNIKENLSASSVALYNYDVDKAPGRMYDPSIDGDLFKIEIYVNDKKSDVDQWFEEERQKINPMTERLYEVSKIESITVDSQKGVYYETRAIYDQNLGSAVFESPREELIHFYGANNYEGNKEIFNLILASFEFLDESWKVYFNEVFGHKVRYPADFSIKDHGTKDKSQIELFKDNYKIVIRASKEKETPYYLDQESSGEIKLGGLNGKQFQFPNGYCDGPECSPPFVAAVAYLSDNQYVLEFYNTIEITGIYQQILSSFSVQF